MSKWWIVFFSLPLYLIGLEYTTLFFQADEWLYMKIASEMYARNEWWITYWLGVPTYYKPPMAYWGMMLFFPFGENQMFWGRVSVAITTLATLFFCYKLSQDLLGKKEACISTALLSCSYGFLAFGRVGVMDMMLLFWLTVSLFCFIRARDRQSLLYTGLFYCSLGLSTLVKGPIAPLISVITAFAALSLYGGWRVFFRPACFPGLLLGLLLSVSWPIALYFKGEFDAWFSFFIIGENFGKFADRLGYPALPFISTIFKWALPWDLFLLALPVFLICKHFWQDRGMVILLLWGITIIGVHLIPAVRLPWYTFLALPAVLMMAGAYISRYSTHWLTRCTLRISALLFLLLALVVSALLRFSFTHFLPYFSIASAAIGLFACAGLLYKGRIVPTCVSLAVAILSLNFLSSYFVDPQFPVSARELLQTSTRPIAVVRIETGRLSQEHAQFSFYLDRPITETRGVEKTTAFFLQGGDLILTDTDYRAWQQQSPMQPEKRRILHSWWQWRDAIPLSQIEAAFRVGDVRMLQEPIHIIRGE